MPTFMKFFFRFIFTDKLLLLAIAASPGVIFSRVLSGKAEKKLSVVSFATENCGVSFIESGIRFFKTDMALLISKLYTTLHEPLGLKSNFSSISKQDEKHSS